MLKLHETIRACAVAHFKNWAEEDSDFLVKHFSHLEQWITLERLTFLNTDQKKEHKEVQALFEQFYTQKKDKGDEVTWLQFRHFLGLLLCTQEWVSETGASDIKDLHQNESPLNSFSSFCL